MKKFFIILYLLAASVDAQNNDNETKKCELNLRTSFSQTSPLLIQNNQFYRQTNGENLTIKTNEEIELFCDEWINSFENIKEGSVNAVCVEGELFNIDGVIYSFKNLQCKDLPRYSSRQTTIKCYNGDDNAVLYEIGYQVDANRFLPLYESCFNGQRTWYTKYIIVNFWNNFIRFERPVFENGIFNMTENYFGSNNQIENLKRIFSGNLPEEIKDLYNRAEFFNRGHLAASSDFVFAPDKNLTFHLINVAPQWSKFNGGNWIEVESATTNYATKTSKDLTTYTGAYGVINFKAYGVDKEFYLGDEILPVPKVFYRIIISENRGVVFLGVNDPFPKNTANINNYIICPDISDDYTWDTSFESWHKNRQDLTKGFSYACDLNDFLKVVEIADIEKVSGILGVIREEENYFKDHSNMLIFIILTIVFLSIVIYVISLKHKKLSTVFGGKVEAEAKNYEKF